MSIARQAFPSCCGINIISGFGKTDTATVKNSASIKEVEAEVKEKEKNTGVGLLLIALNEDQIDVYAKMMKRLGYAPLVEEFMHYGHGNTITLYGKVLTEKNAERNIIGRRTKDSMMGKNNSANDAYIEDYDDDDILADDYD